MENSNINFHQTFKPERQYIASLLDYSNNTSGFHSAKEISLETGIPTGESSGKVIPHIEYANYMGLLSFELQNGKYELTPTNLGKIVIQEDPGFMEELTALICHGMLLRPENGASVWSRTFIDVFPKYDTELSIEQCIKELEVFYGDKIKQKNFAPFLGSYEEFFDFFDIFELDKSRTSIVFKNKLPISNDFVFVYAYLLFKYWDEQFCNNNEITADEFELLNFSKVFRWSREETYKVLEMLNDRNILRLNRQMSPYTILRLETEETLLNKLYSELL